MGGSSTRQSPAGTKPSLPIWPGESRSRSTRTPMARPLPKGCGAARRGCRAGPMSPSARGSADRKSVVSGTSVSVRVDLGGRRRHKKKKLNEDRQRLEIQKNVEETQQYTRNKK